MNVDVLAGARQYAACAAFLLALTSASPAIAAIGARLSGVSEDTFRGRSISAGRPAIGLDVAYDDVRGPYIGAQTKSAVASDGTPRFLSAQAYAGYAQRTASGITFDVGLTHTRFSRFSGYGREADYSEVYAGLSDGRSSIRINASPDWLGRGNVTAYAEAAHLISLSDDWSLVLHGGLFLWLSENRPASVPKLRPDARLGLSRHFGRVQLEAGWTIGGPNADRYRGKEHGHHILTIGASVPL
jgi:uncharacterized protein (TIGR02001 family)